VMRTGSFNTYTITGDSKTMTITSKANANGAVANPTTVRLTRIE
jgi:hypothetical protein